MFLEQAGISDHFVGGKKVADVVYIAGTVISISAEALHTQAPFHVNILSEMLKDCEGERMMSFKQKGL